MSGIRARLLNGPPLSLERARQYAADYAAAWQEGCHCYMQPGIVIFSRGPDGDHPKTVATFVATYIDPYLKARNK